MNAHVNLHLTNQYIQDLQIIIMVLHTHCSPSEAAKERKHGINRNFSSSSQSDASGEQIYNYLLHGAWDRNRP